MLEAGKVRGLYQLQVGEAVGHRRWIELASVSNTIERLMDGAVAIGMHMYYPATLFGRHHQLAEVGWINQQIPVLLAVLVWLDDRSCLPRKLHDAVGKHLDTREGQVWYTLVLLHDLAEHFQVCRFAFRIGDQQGGDVGAEFAVLRQLAVKRQYADVFLGGAQLEQRIAMAGIGSGVHPGRDAILVVDLHGLAGSIEHHRFSRAGELAAYAIPAAFGHVAGGGEIGLVANIVAFFLRQALDQRRVYPQALEHGVVGPAGMAVDAAEHHRLFGPAPMVEDFAQFAGLLPVGRAEPGNADDVGLACATGLVFIQYPLLKLGQRLHFIGQVRAHAVESGHYRVAMGVDHARHQHFAREVDLLRAGIGQGLDVGIAANLEDLAVFHRHRLGQWLAGLGGEHLAIEQDEVGCSHGLGRGQRHGGGQQAGNETLHRAPFCFYRWGPRYRAQEVGGPLQMRRVATVNAGSVGACWRSASGRCAQNGAELDLAADA
ncbi:hypothetical protein D9M71_286510 [compost metagenome]